MNLIVLQSTELQQQSQPDNGAEYKDEDVVNENTILPNATTATTLTTTLLPNDDMFWVDLLTKDIRCHHIVHHLRKVTGSMVRVGIVNGLQGYAKVEKIAADQHQHLHLQPQQQQQQQHSTATLTTTNSDGLLPVHSSTKQISNKKNKMRMNPSKELFTGSANKCIPQSNQNTTAHILQQPSKKRNVDRTWTLSSTTSTVMDTEISQIHPNCVGVRLILLFDPRQHQNPIPTTHRNCPIRIGCARPSPPPYITVLLALPFPKRMQSLWSILATFGTVQRIIVCRGILSNVEHTMSSVYTSQHYTPRLLDGLAQGGHTNLPMVQISTTSTLLEFIEQEKSSVSSASIFALPQSPNHNPNIRVESNNTTIQNTNRNSLHDIRIVLDCGGSDDEEEDANEDDANDDTSTNQKMNPPPIRKDHPPKNHSQQISTISRIIHHHFQKKQQPLLQQAQQQQQQQSLSSNSLKYNHCNDDTTTTPPTQINPSITTPADEPIRIPNVWLAIGPERGWTQSEINAMTQWYPHNPYQRAQLGRGILRVDTAVTVGVALIEDAIDHSCIVAHTHSLYRPK